MASSRHRHRFLAKTIHHVSFHNRLTEEDIMWKRRELEVDEEKQRTNRYQSKSRRRSRSRSRSNLRKRSRSSSSSSESQRKPKSNVTQDRKEDNELDFGPPLPSSLGVNADRWDHAFFMQKYPGEYERQIKLSPHRSSTSSDEKEKKKKSKKKKKKKNKHHHHHRDSTKQIRHEKSSERHH